jgi:hypothetical protein
VCGLAGRRGAVRCSPEEGCPPSSNEARGLPDEERNGRIMTHAHRFAAALTACLVSVLPARTAGQVQTQYELTPLELPAELAGNVVTRDINNRGDILGWVIPDRRVGVVVDKDGVRTFTIPGATYMEPDAITTNGAIAVQYYDLSGDRGPLLLDRKGRLTPVTVEGDWAFVNVWDVSDNGIVTGEVYTSEAVLRTFGFIQDRDGTHIIECPGARFTVLLAVNNPGTATGACTGDSGTERFTVNRDGIFTALAVPAGLIFQAEAINNRGVVAGTWSDGVTSRAGVLEDGVLIPIDYPAPPTIDYQDPETGTTLQLTLGSSFTTVTGINDRGEIVGHTEGTYFGPDFSFEAVRAFPFAGAPVH